ncbi:MAG TPA: T9SS type A sorting domain-containing protein [Chitinophagaceae bacterium]|nr:T9SS type A sorting domain-containing protein [Chitinophagaceae bacterium]
MRYFLSVGLLFLFTTIAAQVQTERYVSMTPLSNAFYEYLPQGYSSNGSQKYPLMIFVHGLGEIGDGSPSQLPSVLRNGPPKLIDQGIFPNSFVVNGQPFSYIVLSPQFTQWPDDIDIENIINYAIQNYHVDTTRIYLTGLSMGGGVVWQYVGDDINYGKRIAAIVPIAGASYPDNSRCANIAAANIAVWATHNDSDHTVSSYNTINYVNKINAVPVPPNPLAIKTIFQSNVHDAWTQTYDVNFKPNGKNVYEWMLQYKSGSSTLAVTGLDFNARKKDNHTVILNWATYSESNNRGFVVERSKNGIAFDSIGFVPSLSIAGKGANYAFTDLPSFGGKLFYRIQQINLDNTYQLSPIKFIQLNNGSYVKVYPNPVKDILSINTSYTFSNSQLNIYNVNGQLLMRKSLNGSGTSNISVKKLPAGLYSAKISDNTNNINFRFQKN